MRPIVELQAEINDAGVEADQLVLEAEFRLSRIGQSPAALQQLEEDGLIEFPGAMLVGIGQSGFRWSLAQAQMLQLTLRGGQSLGDFTQAVRPSQLAEQHGDELTPAGKASSVPLGSMLANCSLELGPRKQLQKLAENTAYSIHGGCLSDSSSGLLRTHFTLQEAPPASPLSPILKS